MHVFVTGATGFIGLHTTLALLRAGHTVRLGVRNAQKMQSLFAQHGIDPTDFAVGEITDKVSIDRALDGCEAVVHTAALVSLDPTQADLMHKTNVTGTKLVIGGAVERGIDAIIYVSSAAALFDPALQVIDDSTPLARARTPYARSKVDAEAFVRGLMDRGANIAITYPTGVIGPDDPAASEANESLLFILNRFHVHTSTGMQIIDVRDLARAHCSLLEGRHAGRFLAAGHYVPWRELGEIIERVTRRRLLKLPVPGPAMRFAGAVGDLVDRFYSNDLPITREAMDFATRWVRCDDARLRALLDFEYRPVAATVRDTVRWLAANGRVAPRWAEHLDDH